MATATITITSATNPTYGGNIACDTLGPSYNRKTLDTEDAAVSFDGVVTVKRAFAFFDLSTDPTSGGDITKVELLATVSSVSGTHEIDTFEGNADDLGIYAGSSDDTLYALPDFANLASSSLATAAGAFVNDLGANASISANGAIAAHSYFLVAIKLSNEAAAGSVVFDAATGFGLRITYTPVATGFNAMMMTGAGA